jgi:hypothetical protein
MLVIPYPLPFSLSLQGCFYDIHNVCPSLLIKDNRQTGKNVIFFFIFTPAGGGGMLGSNNFSTE